LVSPKRCQAKNGHARRRSFELEEAALYYGGVDDVLGQRFTAAAEVAIA